MTRNETPLILTVGENAFAMTPDIKDMLMAHGHLQKVPAGYELSSEAKLRQDPGSTGVNHNEPMAVQAMLKAALSALPLAAALDIAELEWVGPDLHGEWRTISGLISYRVGAKTGNGFWLSEVGRYFPDPEGAFKAAREHYRARMLSQFRTAPLAAAGHFIKTIWPDGATSFQVVPDERAGQPDVVALFERPLDE